MAEEDSGLNERLGRLEGILDKMLDVNLNKRLGRLEGILDRMLGEMNLVLKDSNRDDSESSSESDNEVASADPAIESGGSDANEAMPRDLQLATGCGAGVTCDDNSAGPFTADSAGDKEASQSQARGNLATKSGSIPAADNALSASDDDMAAIFAHPRDQEVEGVMVGDALAQFLKKTHAMGLDAKDVRALEERYNLLPLNVPIAAPKINDCIWDNLQKDVKDADKKERAIQKRGISALCPLLEVCDSLATAVRGKEGLTADQTTSLLKKALDSANLLTLGNREISLNRRENIKPYMAQKYVKLCDADTPIGRSFLFGDNLQETVKNMKDEPPSLVKEVTTASQQSRSQRRYKPYNNGRHAHSKGSYQGAFNKFKQAFTRLPFLGRQSGPNGNPHRAPYQQRQNYKPASGRPNSRGKPRQK